MIGTQVLPLLRQPLQTMTYDRAGIGDRDPRPDHQQPVSYSAIAAELHNLLDALQAPEPYILVAHSFGGLIARSYLAIHEARVAGLVMVDTSVPHARLWPDLSPYRDGDRADATTIDIATGATELPTPTRGRPAVVLARTPRRMERPTSRRRHRRLLAAHTVTARHRPWRRPRHRGLRRPPAQRGGPPPGRPRGRHRGGRSHH